MASILEDVGRLRVRLVMQAALEAEMTEFLGRARYQRHEAAVESRPGARNGWQPPTAIKTTMGPVAVQRPKLRGTDERFCSWLFGLGVTRTNALESLVISGWVRGLPLGARKEPRQTGGSGQWVGPPPSPPETRRKQRPGRGENACV
jgi:putative transposase